MAIESDIGSEDWKSAVTVQLYKGKGETVTRCSEYAEEGHRWMECKIKLRNA